MADLSQQTPRLGTGTVGFAEPTGFGKDFSRALMIFGDADAARGKPHLEEWTAAFTK